TGNPAPASAYSRPATQAPTGGSYGMSSPPQMSPRPGAYGAAPQPGASQYLRPEMTSTAGGNSLAPAYDGAAPGSASNYQYNRPSNSMNPPMPDNIGNYQPSTDAELRFLPPVN